MMERAEARQPIEAQQLTEVRPMETKSTAKSTAKSATREPKRRKPAAPATAPNPAATGDLPTVLRWARGRLRTLGGRLNYALEAYSDRGRQLEALLRVASEAQMLAEDLLAAVDRLDQPAED